MAAARGAAARYHAPSPTARPVALIVDFSIVLLLVLLNGFLAMSELAVVSSRRTRLQAMADAGSRGARVALELAEQPGPFLSTVQVGITLVGLVAGVYSGTSIAEPLLPRLQAAGLTPQLSGLVAFGGVVAAVTFLSLVIGELVPKRFALQNPERMAAWVAPAMALLTRFAWPVVFILDVSSRAVMWPLRSRMTREARVTNEEIRLLIADAESAGLMPPQTRSMMSGVMRLGVRNVRAIMTTRQNVDWIDLDDDDATIRAGLRASRHTHLPACRGSIDAVVGVLSAKDVLDAYLAGAAGNVRTQVQEAPVVVDSVSALHAMEILRGSRVHMVLVVDEYGAFQGLVTTTNLLEAIAGAFPGQREDSAPAGVRRADGSWLLDGDLPVDEMAELIGILLPAKRAYHTVAGLVLAKIMRIPQVGESFIYRGWRFEVIDMDGRRIDKILAVRVPDRRRTGS